MGHTIAVLFLFIKRKRMTKYLMLWGYTTAVYLFFLIKIKSCIFVNINFMWMLVTKKKTTLTSRAF
jgi:hypothetical protein